MEFPSPDYPVMQTKIFQEAGTNFYANGLVGKDLNTGKIDVIFEITDHNKAILRDPDAVNVFSFTPEEWADFKAQVDLCIMQMSEYK